MEHNVSSFIAAPVSEEISASSPTRAKAARSSTVAVATQVSRTYLNCGLTEEEIADRVMMAAAKAGIAVEFGKALGL